MCVRRAGAQSRAAFGQGFIGGEDAPLLALHRLGVKEYGHSHVLE
jgi:hypothetical protein